MDEETQMKLLGERMRRAREGKGMSQEQLAYEWGKKQYQISEYENGKRRIYAHDLPQLAAVLQMPIIYFFQDFAEFVDTDTDEMQEEQFIHILRNLRSKPAKAFALTLLLELQKMLDEDST